MLSNIIGVFFLEGEVDGEGGGCRRRAKSTRGDPGTHFFLNLFIWALGESVKDEHRDA